MTPNVYTGCFTESCHLCEVCICGKSAVEVQPFCGFVLQGLLFAEGGSFFGLVLWMVSRACPPQLKSGYSGMEFDWLQQLNTTAQNFAIAAS